MVSFGFANVVTMALVISLFGVYRAINLLIDFDKENRSEVEAEASHRKEVAQKVEGIVEKLDDNFKTVMADLDSITGLFTPPTCRMDC